MPAEELVRTFCEKVVNARNLDLIDELFAEDYCLHADFHALRAQSREEFKQMVSRLEAELPHLHVTLSRVVVNGEKEVDAVWTIDSDGDDEGGADRGLTARITGATVFLIENGRITGAWAEWGSARRAA